MKKVFSIITFTFLVLSVNAQKSLPDVMFRGKITYERNTDVHKQLDDMGKLGSSSWIDRAKSKVDRNKIDVFELAFNTEASVYQAGEDGVEESGMMFMSTPANSNIVHNDYVNKRMINQKEIYDKTLLVKDSLRKFDWKLKEDFRTIAGYNCRRAETIIMDSIWVVAFYTDGIIAPGGPESFNGLPGMILGIAIPRLHVTWFAKDVQVYLEKSRTFDPPSKGKEYSYESMQAYLAKNLSRWGKYVNRILWYSNL